MLIHKINLTGHKKAHVAYGYWSCGRRELSLRFSIEDPSFFLGVAVTIISKRFLTPITQVHSLPIFWKEPGKTNSWNKKNFQIFFEVVFHYLEYQLDVINVKNFHEILRYLFQILATPLSSQNTNEASLCVQPEVMYTIYICMQLSLWRNRPYLQPEVA